MGYNCLFSLLFDINDWFIDLKSNSNILSWMSMAFFSSGVSLILTYMKIYLYWIFNWRLKFPFLRGFLPHQPWWQLYQVGRCNNQAIPDHYYPCAEPLRHTGVSHLSRPHLLLIQMVRLYPSHLGRSPTSQNMWDEYRNIRSCWLFSFLFLHMQPITVSSFYTVYQ